MLVTFPSMGTLGIVLGTLLKSFGLKVLPPPPVTKRTMEIGVIHAPETACLPLKITLGSFIEALEQGADTIVTCGGSGPCRLGYYAEVQKNILRDLGYRPDFVIVEPGIGSVLKALRLLTPGRNWREIYQGFRLAGAKMTALDTMERQACFVRPREKKLGSADVVVQEAAVLVNQAAYPAEVAAALGYFREKMLAVDVDCQRQPLRVGVVGEIYVMLESFANQDLLRHLGRMGVEVQPTLLLGDYVQTHIVKAGQARRINAVVESLATPYLGHYVGGHGLKSIGQTVRLAKAGYDGVIHVFPFTCMPEVIAQNILPQVSEASGIPVLSLAFDEQTGLAGVVTRLEAFTDLLAYRRGRKARRESGLLLAPGG
ncbi:MAG: hypothetical protein P4N59_29345 [Negativicutes bacterium]|nr:hypothetical protein [Negativicutes bacterium]